MLDLRGCREKIKRAKKHISDLDVERVRFLDTNPYTWTSQFDEEACETTFFLGPLPEMPAVLSVFLGDAIHNLRSALDHLAFALVKCSDPLSPAKHVYFPICQSPKEYIPESERKTKGMALSAKQFIDRLRPYQGGNEA